MSPRLVPGALAQHATRRLKVLGPPIRVSLLNALREELRVQGLLDSTGQRRANVSKPLGILAREAQRITRPYYHAN